MSVGRPLIALILLLLTFGGEALGNGKRGRIIDYRGFAPSGDVEFSSSLEDVLFRLNSVENKYKVMRIRIRNHGSSDLMLSAEHDAVEVTLESGEVVSGVLNLAAQDGELWDRLDAELRSSLAYPESVEEDEEENVFVFFPKAAVKSLPAVLAYQLRSVADGPILMMDRGVAAH